MNRRKFFQSLGLAAICAPLVGWAKSKQGDTPSDKLEGPFYGVDYGGPGDMVTIAETWFYGDDHRALVNVYSIEPAGNKGGRNGKIS